MLCINKLLEKLIANNFFFEFIATIYYTKGYKCYIYMELLLLIINCPNQFSSLLPSLRMCIYSVFVTKLLIIDDFHSAIFRLWS